jgi:hypothetical protein
LKPKKTPSIAKQKKCTTKEPTQDETSFMDQITLNHATAVAVYLDYCEAIAKLEGIEPNVVKARVQRRINDILPPASPFKNKM